jgi:Uma2 family endonuclease
MSDPYDEIFDGETFIRLPPGERHERICDWLREQLTDCLGAASGMRILPSRTIIKLNAGTFVRPDISVIEIATGRIWLAVEVISSDDHHTDTVTKKSAYEDVRINRLWMVDPRYDNVEVYHGSQYGLVLKRILAGRETLSEEQFPGFEVPMDQLFSR